jgi:hypothetical protein
VIYRWRDGQISVFACDKEEYLVAIARETIWETLSENMPALQSYWLGIELKTITETGKELTLGFTGSARPSALVIRGRVEVGELLADALDRELTELLGIEDYEVLDVLDDGGTMEHEGVEEPLFTAVIKVERFEVDKKLPEVGVDWVELDKPLVN